MRILLRFIILPIAVLLILVAGTIWFVGEGVTGVDHARGEVAAEPIPAEAVRERAARQEAAGAGDQILFGDLHVHTTYSTDAFAFSLPIFQGEGVHPPADACDFARFCAQLDFFSLNDHAAGILPWQWAETREAVRECNAVAGNETNPDLVSFLGWEWTQMSPGDVADPERKIDHFGHKNVIFRETADDRVPTRPIGAALPIEEGTAPGRLTVDAGLTLVSVLDMPGNVRPYLDFNRYMHGVIDTPNCPKGVPVRDLPADCTELAATPAELFSKLDDWGFPSLVIPHGTAWGIHAPVGGELGIQLAPGMHDPARQRLFEVYSGHGNSEQWRDLQDVVTDAEGQKTCAAPTADYEPCCHRAGEIIRARCGEAPGDVCQARVDQARQAFVDSPAGRGFMVVGGSKPEAWGECGQLAGTFLPAYQYRPGMSAQYGLAVRPEGSEGAFRYGLIGSSDNHKARPGPGYKEVGRKVFGDAYGFRQDWKDLVEGDPLAEPEEAFTPDALPDAPLNRFDPGSERSGSYYYTSGLVAVHAEGRDRDSIWNALEARNVYGTSGPRILLWFDHLGAEDDVTPMGSEVEAAEAPRFRVRAVGSFRQKPGCPAFVSDRLTPARLDRLCMNECYHPSDVRHEIERIEVVRIRPQQAPDEPMADLIEDPWKTFVCEPSGDGCSATFEDADWSPDREHVYYVRALQVPTDAVNGDPMRCTRDAAGRCLEARGCPASGRDFVPSDDCLAPVQERAWSSPIFVTGTGTSTATAMVSEN